MSQPIDLDELESGLRGNSHIIDKRTWLVLDRLRYLTAGLTDIRDGDHNRQQARVIADGLLSGTWSPTSHQEDS